VPGLALGAHAICGIDSLQALALAISYLRYQLKDFGHSENAWRTFEQESAAACVADTHSLHRAHDYTHSCRNSRSKPEAVP